ncbi:hypothetical protein Egran_02631, partial [Elaphomyces granulatus]
IDAVASPLPFNGPHWRSFSASISQVLTFYYIISISNAIFRAECAIQPGLIKMGLHHLPVELLVIIINLVIYPGWNECKKPQGLLNLRLVCKILDLIVSECAFRKLNPRSLEDQSWRISDCTIAWLLGIKIRLSSNGRIPLDNLTEAVRSAAGSMAHLGGESKVEEDYWRTACEVVVAYRGRGWVSEQLKSSSVTLSSDPSCMIGQGPQHHDLLMAAYLGDKRMIEALLKHDVDVNVNDHYLGNAMYAAAYRGNADIVNLLIKHGAHATSRGYRGSCLEAAAYQGHDNVMAVLLNNGANVNGVGPVSPLTASSSKGCLEAVRLLLAQPGIDVNFRSILGQTSLVIAMQGRHSKVAQVLLERKDLDASIPDDAAFYGRKKVVQLLLERDDVNPNEHSGYGDTPLWEASLRGHEAVVSLLLKRGDIQPNLGFSHSTPLMCAVQEGHEAVVKSLLDCEAVDPDIRNGYQETPLAVAAKAGMETIVIMLLNRGARTDIGDLHDQTPLSLATKNGHEPVVRLLLKQDGINTRAVDYFGRIALQWAAIGGYEQIFRLLLERGDSDVNFKDRGGRTSLCLAARLGHPCIVRYLLKRNDLDVDSKDWKGRTPLLWAKARNNTEIVQLLSGKTDDSREQQQQS